MKTILLTSFYLTLLIACLISCKKKDEDYEAMRAATQEVVDQIAHTWQIDRLYISSESGDTVLTNAGYIRFSPCEVDRDDLAGCDAGDYEFKGQQSISFRYYVDAPPRSLAVGIRPDQYPVDSPAMLDLYDNWKVMKVSEDSLTLEGKSRVMQLSK